MHRSKDELIVVESWCQANIYIYIYISWLKSVIQVQLFKLYLIMSNPDDQRAGSTLLTVSGEWDVSGGELTQLPGVVGHCLITGEQN